MKWPITKLIKYLLALLLLIFVIFATKVFAPIDTETDNLSDDISDNTLATYLNTPLTVKYASAILEQPISYFEKIEATQTRNARIESLVSYLKKVNSPIATTHYAELIIDLAQQSGVDYRVVVALMGTESGWCKKPIHFNCFGYLNGAVYDSFDDAFNHLIPKISKQYLVKYGWDFAGFVSKYGLLDAQAAYVYGRKMYSIAIKLYY